MAVVEGFPYSLLVLVLGVLIERAVPSLRRRTAWYSHGLPRALLVLLVTLAWFWLKVVNTKVPQPYLDEVFHIPQATKYLKGKWLEWDDKITTPPGLYLISYALLKTQEWVRRVVPGLAGGSAALDHPASSLRETTTYAILVLAGLAAWCRKLIESRGPGSGSNSAIQIELRSISFYSLHTAFNIALFPVIFFFSGLYYTDLWSTATVLWAYQHHLRRVSTSKTPSLISDLTTIVYGVVSLWMRQTNVFWVVVYFGGLEAIHALKSLAPPNFVERNFEERDFPDVLSAVKAYFRLYASGNIHDPPLGSASLYDVVWLAVSVAVAALCNLPRVLRQVWPHIFTVALFGAFVAWNGGVVLGDKSNHIATLHVAQMLYIWPLFVFFSAPLLLRFVGPVKTYFQGLVSGPAPLWYLSLPLAVAIIRSSTIIHPFTLADNRHYMFYVFRYTVRRTGVRYMLAPVYVLCHRLCWQLLCGSLPSAESHSRTSATSAGGQQLETRWLNAPATGYSTTKAQASKSSPAVSSQQRPDVHSQVTVTWLDDQASETTSRRAEPLSTALFWLLASALSLVTAPLVEPRYFIVPWVLWRLLVPAWKMGPAGDATSAGGTKSNNGGGGDRSLLGQLRSWGQKVDFCLVLETLWFAAINIATMALFIYRPYYWRNAEGDLLDSGRLQRFMW